MAGLASLIAVVHGRVQGVFFRDFVKRQAQSLGLTGYVRNLPDGSSVEVVAEGEADKLAELEESLNVGPVQARVDKVAASSGEYSGRYTDFSITR